MTWVLNIPLFLSDESLSDQHKKILKQKKNRKRELGQFWTGFKSSAQVVKTNAVAQVRILVMVKFYTHDIILL